jgi:hypothetical protein
MSDDLRTGMSSDSDSISSADSMDALLGLLKDDFTVLPVTSGHKAFAPALAALSSTKPHQQGHRHNRDVGSGPMSLASLTLAGSLTQTLRSKAEVLGSPQAAAPLQGSQSVGYTGGLSKRERRQEKAPEIDYDVKLKAPTEANLAALDSSLEGASPFASGTQAPATTPVKPFPEGNEPWSRLSTSGRRASRPLQPVAASRPLQPVAASRPLQPVAASSCNEMGTAYFNGNYVPEGDSLASDQAGSVQQGSIFQVCTMEGMHVLLTRV